MHGIHVASPQGTEQLPSHLVATSDPSWAFWQTIFLRGSGFEAQLVDQLADQLCARASEQVLACEREVLDAQRAALTALGDALGSAADEAARRPIARALRQLRKGRLPDDQRLIPDAARLALLAARTRRDEHRRQYSNAFDRCAAETTERITALADDPRFRQAVLLQNARAFGHVRHVLSRAAPAKRRFKERQAQELIASYLQRYCVKNDTIGFFGPVGWAAFDMARLGIGVETGPGLVARTSVHFENWAIETLADQISRDPAYRPWLRPRLLPLFHVDVDAGQLHLPGGRRTGLGRLDLEILQRCDGARTARQIALEILARTVSGVASAEDVYEALRRLVARQAVRWTIEIPYSVHPERSLREALEPVQSEPLRRRAAALLDELEDGRDRVRAALGDPDRLAGALQTLHASFERLTGQASAREHGRMYAGRTLVYTDCERDGDVRIGRDVVEALIGPLSLVLKSARWLTHCVATRYRTAFDEIYRELAAAHGAPVDLTRFWASAQGLVLDRGTRGLDTAAAEWRRRWALILPVTPDQRRVRYTTADLRPAVDDLFQAPRAGWASARYHSPDVMIAARSPDAIARGEYFAVLGEVHLATHTFCGAFTLAQHPDPERLRAAMDADSDTPGVTPVPPKAWPRLTGRTSLALVPRHNYYFEVSPDVVVQVPRSRALPIASLVVDRTDGLRVRTRDGRLSFDIVEFFGELLSLATIEIMKELYAGAHVPRITIDKMVIKRESWTFSANELDFVDIADERERYLRLRAWKHGAGLPRRMFVSVPVEAKPFFVDFDSPIYGEILVKGLRRVRASEGPQAVTLSEMLPTPEQLWLHDAHQRHYTSELRIIARDLLR